MTPLLRCLDDDETFDSMFPDWAARLSRGNWTPVAVARRAAQLLVSAPGMRVLDVGAGVGKFCIVGALTTGGHFCGIEQRSHFVAAARAVAARLGVATATFTAGDITTIDWRSFAGFYLFNPFAEYFDTLLAPLDDAVAVNRPLHASYVSHVHAQLERAAAGTIVVTYTGFGGELPASYRLDHVEPAEDDQLERWIKAI
jgi:cyclopropane fatty-acyl-phospholipid synthase-like methyltransferase